MNEPYFQVGEEATVCHDEFPQRNGDVVIVDIRFGMDGFNDPRSRKIIIPVEDVTYEVDRDLDGTGYYWVKQSALRKKHKPSTQSFSTLITTLKPREKTA